MAFTVFPERMDKLDLEDTERSLAVLENYLNYMQERVEFSFTNMFRTVQGAGTSTAEILVLLAGLSNSLSALTSTVNQLSGTVTGLSTTVGNHTSQITALQTGKQNTLTFDATPTEDSTNPVTSDGIYTVDEGFDTRITALETALSASGPILYQQPTDITVADGEDAVFSVRVIGSNLTYLWELYYGSNWITPNLDGVHTSDMTVHAQTSQNGYKFRCTITGGGWTVYSKTVTLHVT